MSWFLFWGLLALVCLSPLPLASNRPLPATVLALGVGLLLIGWGAQRLWREWRARRLAAASALPAAGADPPPPERAADDADRFALVLAVGFSVLLAWYWAQTSPALTAWVAHPVWAEAARALGETLPASASVDPAAGGATLMKVLAYGGIFLLAFMFGRDRRRARLAFWAVALSGAAYAVYGLAMHFGRFGLVLWFPKTDYVESVTSTFINRNAYATYAGLATIAALAPLLSELRRIGRGRTEGFADFVRTVSREAGLGLYVALAACALGVTAVVLTGSRAGFAALVLGGLAFGVLLLAARDIAWRHFALAGAAVAALVGGALAIGGEQLTTRLARDGVFGREGLFDVGAIAAAQRPWTGHGLGGFAPAFNRANDGRFIAEDRYVDLAHSTWLELAIEAGLPALILNLALLGLIVGILLQGVLTRSRGTSFAMAGIAVALQVGAHALVDFGFQMPAVAANFMLLMGVAAAQALTGERAQPQLARLEAPRRRSAGAVPGRPSHAEEAVTPRHHPEMPWPVRPTDRPVATDIAERASESEATAAGAPHRGPGHPAQQGQGSPQSADAPARAEAAAAPDQGQRALRADAPFDVDYGAALARWRALQLRDPGAAAAPNLRERGVTGLPALPDPALREQPSDDILHAFRPSASEDLPLLGAEGGTAAYGDEEQPPTPTAWPGAAAAAAQMPDDGGLDDATQTSGPRRAATVHALPRVGRGADRR